VEQQAHIDRLQSRLDALEYENDRLRSAADEPKGVDLDASSSNDAQAEREQSLVTRISDLEAQLQAAESSFDERGSTIESLRGAISELQRQKEEEERRAEDLATKLSESTAFTERLNTMVVVKDVAERELDSILKSKNADVVVLEGQVDNLNAQLEVERKELEGQINELRMAGQVRCFQKISG
jgi:CAP-Gly domain-containing linker protein 1